MTTEQDQTQIPFSRNARKLLGRAISNGVDPFTVIETAGIAASVARAQSQLVVTRDYVSSVFGDELRGRISRPPEEGRFDLRGFDFRTRRPEISEIFDDFEAQTYIDGCDYPESVDDFLLALEIARSFGPSGLRDKRILDAMCGPGRLGRELLSLGAETMVFHDGDENMSAHAVKKALEVAQKGQSIEAVTSNADNIPLPDNSFDLIVSHNSTHQLSSIARLGQVMKEFLRLTKPGGHIIIADYQRGTTEDFLLSLEERLRNTKPEIVPLLIPSFMAAYSKGEFTKIIRSMSDISNWSVEDAKPPELTPLLQDIIDQDPVKGHLMDYSPISLRVSIQKSE